MIVKVGRDEFLGAFSRCDIVASAEAVRPILGQFLFDAAGDGCHLRSADLVVSVAASCGGVEVVDAGRALLPRDRTRQILTTSRDETLEIVSTGSATGFRGTNARFELLTPHPAEFPTFSETANGVAHVLDAGHLADVIRFAGIASGGKVVKDVLVESGLDRDGKTVLQMVGTDGRRLAIAASPCEVLGEGPWPMARRGMLSHGAMSTISRALAKSMGAVTLTMGRFDFSVETADSVLYGQQGAGRFPEYKQAFPRVEPRWTPVDVGVLRAAVEQAEAFTDTTSNSRGVLFTFSKAGLHIHAAGEATLESGSIGVCRAAIDVPMPMDVGDVSLKLDPGYLLQAMRAFERTCDVSLGIVDEKTVATIKAEAIGFTYMVMPMK